MGAEIMLSEPLKFSLKLWAMRKGTGHTPLFDPIPHLMTSE